MTDEFKAGVKTNLADSVALSSGVAIVGAGGIGPALWMSCGLLGSAITVSGHDSLFSTALAGQSGTISTSVSTHHSPMPTISTGTTLPHPSVTASNVGIPYSTNIASAKNFTPPAIPNYRTEPARFLAVAPSDTSAVVSSEKLEFLRHLVSFWHSQIAKADARFLSLASNMDPDDSEIDLLRQRLADFLDQYAEAGMQVILNRLLREGISAEVRHMFFLEIAKINEEQTIAARRTLLSRALHSTDASVRYSAAVALGSMRNDVVAHSILSNQKQREKNPAVRRMIQAQLG